MNNIEKELMFLGWLSLGIGSIFAAYDIGPLMYREYGMPYVITGLLGGITVFILYLVPYMIGAGILFYKRGWQKAEAASAKTGKPVYRYYAIFQVEMFLMHLVIYGIVLTTLAYLITKSGMTESIMVILPFMYWFAGFFLGGFILRIGLEYLEQWGAKRNEMQ